MTHKPDAPVPQTAETRAPARWFNSLSFRLFALTVVAILIVEGFIFVPSASGFRMAWLNERVQAARIAALALDAAPERSVSEELSEQLLENAEVLAVAETEDEMRFQLLSSQMPMDGEMHAEDLRDTTPLSRQLLFFLDNQAANHWRLIVAVNPGALTHATYRTPRADQAKRQAPIRLSPRHGATS